MAFSKLFEDIERGTGKFDTEKRYYVKNWSDEDIEITWSAKDPSANGAGRYLIKSGDLGGPYPQFLAYHIAKHLINREMMREGKEGLIANSIQRIPYEEKTLQEVVEGQEDPRIAEIRAQERAKVEKEMGLKVEEAPKKTRGRPKKEFAGANVE